MTIEGECLIGLKAEVVESKNKHDIGIKGKIVDETKFSIKIGEKRVIKNNITLKINNQKIKGNKIMGRPEERIKKWSKK